MPITIHILRDPGASDGHFVPHPRPWNQKKNCHKYNANMDLCIL